MVSDQFIFLLNSSRTYSCSPLGVHPDILVDPDEIKTDFLGSVSVASVVGIVFGVIFGIALLLVVAFMVIKKMKGKNSKSPLYN